MIRLKRQLLCSFIVSFILVFTISCATERGPSGRISEGALERSHDVVGIRVRPYTLNININEPSKGAGKGALTGAGKAGAGWLGGGAGGDPYAAVVLVALLPVAIVTGAITGAVMAHPEDEVIEATTAIKGALADARPAIGIQEAIVKDCADLKGRQVKVRPLSESEINMSPAQLADLGIDAVLDIEISHLDLIVFGDLNPDASLTMAIRSSILVTDMGTVSASSSYSYMGKRHNYFELAEGDAYLLRESIKQSYKEIAGLLVTDSFK